MVAAAPESDKGSPLPAAYPCRCYAILNKNGRYTPWRFDRMENAAAFRHEARRIGGVALASAQRFPMLPGQKGGLPWKDRPDRHGSQRRGAESFFRGEDAGHSDCLPIWAPFYLDVDSAENPELALRFTRAAANWFRNELGLPEGDMRVWFSGSKGFHVLVNPIALGIKPQADLTRRIMRPVAKRLAHALVRHGAPELELDLSAYSLPRLLRMPGELNPKSGLFKTELSHEELESLDLDAIRAIARNSRCIDAATYSAEPQPKAAAWWQAECNNALEEARFQEKAAEHAGIQHASGNFAGDILVSDEMPDCIVKMLEARAPPGKRNRCELQLACWLRAAGYEESRALSFLADWSAKSRPEKTAEASIGQSRSVIKAAWANRYSFSCRAARSVLQDIALEADCPSCAASSFNAKSFSAIRLRFLSSIPSRISLEKAHELIMRHAQRACWN